MSLDDIRKTKIDKIEKLRRAGVDPYPASSGQTKSISEVVENFDKLSDSKSELVLVGRITARREHGGSVFFDLKDESGKIQ